MDSYLLKESNHTAGFLKEKLKLKTFFLPNGKNQGTKRRCSKNSLKSFIVIHLIYHFMIKSKKTAENCLINILLGHILQHYHFHYLICACHLNHICPELTTAYSVSAAHERIWFWSGICQGGQDSAQNLLGAVWSWITLWSSYIVTACNPSMGSLVYKRSCIQGDRSAVASINTISNHVSPMIRRVTVNYFCLGQKRKDIFTGSQCYPNHLYNKVWKKWPTLDSTDNNYVLAIILVSFKLTDSVSKNCSQLFRAEDWAI